MMTSKIFAALLAAVVLPAMLTAAEPTAAPAGASVCAALPDTGPVASPGPDVEVPPTPAADRTLTCPDDFRLDLKSRVPRCVRPGIKAVDGSPRAQCYAALPLGPLAPIAERRRPTRTCSTPRAITVVRLSGANVGLADAAVTVVPDTGITLTSLTAAEAKVPQAENPVLQSCFAFACRLVKLEITSRAAPQVQLRVALPGQDPVMQTLKLRETCPH